MTHKQPVLDVQGLTVAFSTERGRMEAVSGISFSVGEGETVALVGESGCGKSVAVRSLLRLLPESAAITAKSARLQEHELLQLSPKELQRVRGGVVGYLFQDPGSAFDPVHTVGNQIAETIGIHFPEATKAQRRERSIAALASAGVPEPEYRFDRYPHELSGGLRQRALLAMSLAAGPRLLIADEPTTALDVTIQAQVLELLRQKKREQNLSMIFISHDLSVVASLADRVIVLYAGTIVEQGPVAKVFVTPWHPYTAGLLATLSDLDAPPKGGDRRLLALGGQVPDPFRRDGGCRFRERCSLAVPRCAQSEPPLVDHGDRSVACFVAEERLRG